MSNADRHPVALVTILGLMLGPAVALGLARFAYALVLPAMRTALGWSFATAGEMNTANALGYLIGAPLSGVLAWRVGERCAFIVGMVVTALALAGSAATANTVVLLVLRAVAGASGAVCFVVGAGLAAQAGRSLASPRAGLFLGVYFAGPGVGMVVSGLLVPSVLTVGDWRRRGWYSAGWPWWARWGQYRRLGPHPTRSCRQPRASVTGSAGGGCGYCWAATGSSARDTSPT